MAAEVAKAITAPFRVGKKELYLPDFVLTFKRTPGLPANYAQFIVPLWFSKLDLRDYLYHAYNIRINSIRSYVKQQRIQQGDEKSPKPQPRRWHRPRAKKHMTVELERPFVWPERPDDYSDWNIEEAELMTKEQERLGQILSRMSDTFPNEERQKAMREQAQALLNGKEKWKPATHRSLGSMITR